MYLNAPYRQNGFVKDVAAGRFAPALQFAIWSSVLSIIFLSQIAINIGEFPASVTLACYIGFSLYLLVSNRAAWRLWSILIYFFIGSIAFFRMFQPSEPISWPSFALLLALYAPYTFYLVRRRESASVQDYIESVFVFGASLIAVIAILQLIAVNIFKIGALSNIAFLLPDEIRGAGYYSFIRGADGANFIKANGFFLRESSGLSVITALAFLVEYFSKARLCFLAVLLGGLAASVSGTGLLVVMAGFLIPTSRKRLPVFLLCLPLLFLLMTFGPDIPVLNLWLDRLDEFSMPGSSGYARFVAPTEMVERGVDNGSLAVLFGNGGGSYWRTVSALDRSYEISDPTWAKLIFEYGIAGFLMISALFFYRIYRSGLRREICNALVVVWMSTGALLSVDAAFLMWLLTLAPSVNKIASRNKKRPNT
jgi:hypothetical protein